MLKSTLVAPGRPGRILVARPEQRKIFFRARKMSLLKKISSNFENPYHGSGRNDSNEKEKTIFSPPENSHNEKKNFSSEENAATCGDEDNVKGEPASQADAIRAKQAEAEPIEPESTQAAKSTATTSPELPAAVPCLFCGIGALWLDFNGQFHCYQCEPPPSQSMIRGRWTLSEDNDNGGPATWIDRGRPERMKTAAPAIEPGKRQAAKATTTRGRGGSRSETTTNPPPAAAASMLDRLGHDNAEPWIETTETDSTGRVVRIHRPASLAARGPVMGEGYSSFERDPDDPTGKRLIFSGWQWFDW